uniref:Ig-like domain-containing protein n=1 Tax=Photinus pyralis TaxID=7054 RepID=A0A1Y1KUA9_PHOPY
MLNLHAPYRNNKIIVAPQILPFNFGDDEMNAGDTTSVQCTVVKGDNPLNITWRMNDAEIKTNTQGVSILNSKRVSSLTIESVQAEHAGEYTCVASNVAGYATHSASLNVNGTYLIMFVAF